MSLPKAPANDNNDIQMKITEFLNRESKAGTSRIEAFTPKTPLPSKTVSQVGTSSQVRKPNKPATNPLVTTLTKNTCPSRPEERQMILRRTRPEGKVFPLKSVEIVLPPVMFPFSIQGARSQMPANHLYYRLVGSKACMPSYVTSSAPKRGEKPKENTTPSLLRHPRPWLWLWPFLQAGWDLCLDTVTQDTGALGRLVSSSAILPPENEDGWEILMEGTGWASQGFVSSALICFRMPSCRLMSWQSLSHSSFKVWTKQLSYWREQSTPSSGLLCRLHWGSRTKSCPIPATPAPARTWRPLLSQAVTVGEASWIPMEASFFLKHPTVPETGHARRFCNELRFG